MIKHARHSHIVVPNALNAQMMRTARKRPYRRDSGEAFPPLSPLTKTRSGLAFWYNSAKYFEGTIGKYRDFHTTDTASLGSALDKDGTLKYGAHNFVTNSEGVNTWQLASDMTREPYVGPLPAGISTAILITGSGDGRMLPQGSVAVPIGDYRTISALVKAPEGGQYGKVYIGSGTSQRFGVIFNLITHEAVTNSGAGGGTDITAGAEYISDGFWRIWARAKVAITAPTGVSVGTTWSVAGSTSGDQVIITAVSSCNTTVPMQDNGTSIPQYNKSTGGAHFGPRFQHELTAETGLSYGPNLIPLSMEVAGWVDFEDNEIVKELDGSLTFSAPNVIGVDYVYLESAPLLTLVGGRTYELSVTSKSNTTGSVFLWEGYGDEASYYPVFFRVEDEVYVTKTYLFTPPATITQFILWGIDEVNYNASYSLKDATLREVISPASTEPHGVLIEPDGRNLSPSGLLSGSNYTREENNWVAAGYGIRETITPDVLHRATFVYTETISLTNHVVRFLVRPTENRRYIVWWTFTGEIKVNIDLIDRTFSDAHVEIQAVTFEDGPNGAVWVTVNVDGSRDNASSNIDIAIDATYDTNYTGDPSEGLDIAYYQVEDQRQPLSTIPAVGTVEGVRTTDLITNDALNWLNPLGGTFLVEFFWHAGPSPDHTIFQIDNGIGVSLIDVHVAPSGFVNILVKANNVTEANLTLDVPLKGRNRLAFSVDSNNLNASLNGAVAPITPVVGDLPPTLSVLRIGQSNSTGRALSESVSRLEYYDAILAGAELEVMSTL